MRWRLVILALILIAALSLLAFMLSDPSRRQLLHGPQHLGQQARLWSDANPVKAEVALFVLYILLTLVALPVWWLNILAGYSFGLIGGTVRCVLASAIAAAITARLWKWLAGDVAEHDLVPRLHMLRILKAYSSKGGLIIVLLARLAHLIPFGLSNYLFGMLGIPWPTVFVGTLIGVIPAVATAVSLGAGRDWHAHWAFILTIGIISIAGLVLGGYLYARHRYLPEEQPTDSP